MTIDLDTSDIDRLEPADVLLTFGPDAVHEEIATYGIAPTACLVAVQQQTDIALVANSNFLKKAFLEGYQRKGLCDDTPQKDKILQSPWKSYSIGYSVGVFDQNDHDVFYLAENRWWEQNQTMLNIHYHANSEAIEDAEWGNLYRERNGRK